MDDRLLDAAVALLEEHGLDGLTLERVAERVGRSRVTLWRQQVTQEALVDGLLARLTRDFRDAMWPALAEAGTGAQRLTSALSALVGVAERHLHLLGVADDVFDRAAQRMRDVTGQSFSFADPFLSALRAGVADGSLDPGPVPVSDAAAAIFATVCWGYVHLRRRAGWEADRARAAIITPALAGLAPGRSSPGRRSPST